MRTLYDIKPHFVRLLTPLAATLVRRGLEANDVTRIALAGSVVAGLLVALLPSAGWPLVVLALWMPLRLALNAVDGIMAREWGQKSRSGAILNEAGDVAADLALYLPLALVPDGAPVAFVAFAATAALTEVIALASLAAGGVRSYAGPMGKSDRAAAIGLLALLLGLGVPGGAWMPIVVWVLCFMTAVTAYNRFRAATGEAET